MPTPRRILPPLNAVRAFEAAARHGSFKDAAIELGVTHGAISRRVGKGACAVPTIGKSGCADEWWARDRTRSRPFALPTLPAIVCVGKSEQ
jgi:hypothetical protein